MGKDCTAFKATLGLFLHPSRNMGTMHKIFGLFFFALVSLACSDDDNGTGEDCRVVLCTEDFRTVTVKVRDGSGVVVPLDRFEVVNSATGEDLTPVIDQREMEQHRLEGSYPIFTDARSKEYRNKSLKVRFTGFISEKEVVRAEFVVGADCCHVKLLEGDPNIVVD